MIRRTVSDLSIRNKELTASNNNKRLSKKIEKTFDQIDEPDIYTVPIPEEKYIYDDLSKVEDIMAGKSNIEICFVYLGEYYQGIENPPDISDEHKKNIESTPPICKKLLKKSKSFHKVDKILERDGYCFVCIEKTYTGTPKYARSEKDLKVIFDSVEIVDESSPSPIHLVQVVPEHFLSKDDPQIDKCCYARYEKDPVTTFDATIVVEEISSSLPIYTPSEVSDYFLSISDVGWVRGVYII